jgi:hypothetical protein
VRGRRPGQRDDRRAAVLSTTAPSSVTVAGRELTFPVEVREASSWAAQFPVRSDAAQRLIDHTGLRIAPVFPGRTLLTLAYVRYADTDLDAYNELGVIFLVRGPRGRGVYIHHLPVDREFTLAAGRQIWGYPKFLADVFIDEDARGSTCTLRHEGSEVLQLRVRRGLLPVPQPALPTYTFCDNALLVTSWETAGRARGRPGGATLRLGDHPIAEELRGLGLPRRALASSAVARFSARFGPARELRRVASPGIA